MDSYSTIFNREGHDVTDLGGEVRWRETTGCRPYYPPRGDIVVGNLFQRCQSFSPLHKGPEDWKVTEVWPDPTKTYRIVKIEDNGDVRGVEIKAGSNCGGIGETVIIFPGHAITTRWISPR